MGNSTQKQVPLLKQANEDFFILSDISDIVSLFQNHREKEYFCLNFDQKQNIKIDFDVIHCQSMDEFDQKSSVLPQSTRIIIICSNLQTRQLEALDSNEKVSQIFIISTQPGLMQLKINNFAKTNKHVFEIFSLQKHLSYIKHANRHKQKTSILMYCKEDIFKLNQYRIIFQSFINSKSKTQAKNDFIRFAKAIYPQHLSHINRFQIDYQTTPSQTQPALQTAKWLAQPNGFFYQSMKDLLALTTNPNQLSYLRFPIKQSFNAILNLKKKTKKFHLIYALIKFTDQQLEKIQNGQGQFLMFSYFVKGYTTKRDALRASRCCKNQFIVTFENSNRMQNQEESACMGYYVYENVSEAPNVIFNICNIFQIRWFDKQQKQIELCYDSFAMLARYFKKQIRYQKQHEYQLKQKHLYFQSLKSQTNCQTKIYEMLGNYKDLLLICQKKMENALKFQSNSIILDELRIQLGSAFKMNKNYQKAEETFLSIKSQNIALIANLYLAEIFLEQQKKQKFKSMIERISVYVSKSTFVNKKDKFRAKTLIGISLIIQGKYKQGISFCKQLNIQAYDQKMDKDPLFKRITLIRSICLIKLNCFNEALCILKYLLNQQQNCEGNSPSLFLTKILLLYIEITQDYLVTQNKRKVIEKQANKLPFQQIAFFNHSPFAEYYQITGILQQKRLELETFLCETWYEWDEDIAYELSRIIFEPAIGAIQNDETSKNERERNGNKLISQQIDLQQ